MVSQMIKGAPEGRRGVTIGEQPIEVRRYLNALRRSWLFIVAFVGVVVVVTVLGSSLAEKRYRTTATIIEGSALLSGDTSSVESNQRQLATIQRLLKTNAVLDLALKELRGQTRQSISDAISSSLDPAANVINVTAEDSDPKAAAAIANAASVALLKAHADAETSGLTSARAELLVQLSRLRSSGAPAEELQAVRDRISELVIAQASIGNDLRLAQPAEVQSSAFTPRPFRNGVIAFFATIFLAILIVIGRDLLRPRISDSRELAQLVDLPLLARIPLRRGRVAGRATAVAMAAAEEAYQTLQASIRYVHQEGHKVIVVSSALEKEGKTTTAIGLAKALARAGQKVLLICADLRLPTLHERLEIPRSPGLADLLKRASSPSTVVKDMQSATRNVAAFGTGSLDAIPSGSRVTNPTELLFGGPFETVLDALGLLDYDFVVIDGPPLLGIADGHALARRADSVLLVARPDRLTVEQVIEVREKLTWLHATAVGLVTCERFRNEHTYGYVYARAEAEKESAKGSPGTTRRPAVENGAPITDRAANEALKPQPGALRRPR